MVPRFAAGLLAGTLPLAWMPALPSPAWVAALILAAGVLAWRFDTGALAGAAAGLALALGAAHARLEPALAPALEGRDLVVTGRIVDLPERRARSTRFRLATEGARVHGRAVPVPRRLRLTWYGPERPALVPGQRWRLTLRLERRRGFANPGGFDYALWLFRAGIGATGYVRDQPPPRLLTGGGGSLDGIRHALRARIRAATTEARHRPLLLALALGDRSAIADPAWDTLRATGTTHLVAISGLHIGLAALAGFGLGAGLWRCVLPWHRRVPRPIVQAWTAIGCAAAYAALAGFSLPTVRALVMLAVGLAAVLGRRRARPLEGLAAAVVAVLVWDPLAPLGPSFWLSFGAVAAILWLVTGRVADHARKTRWIRLQLGIAVVLTPLLIAFFGQASTVAPAANLVAIPWTSLLVVPPALAGTVLVPLAPGLSELVFGVADASMAWLWLLLEWLAGWRLADWAAARPPAWVAALAVGGALLTVGPRGLPARGAGVVALLPLLLWSPARPEAGAVRLDLLDVGQGLAVVVRTHGHTLVYDTGPAYGTGFDAGSAVVVPFLRAAGVSRLDALVLSHLDRDHAGGAGAVRRALRPRRVWTSAPHRVAGPARLCARGAGWRWDGVTFRFLHPDPDDAFIGNDASCVLRIDTPGGSILLPGDIEAAAERRLLARPAPLAADVVVAPHHGSATSSTPAFVAAVEAHWVLYPVGYRNQWDFPRAGVLARWRPAGTARTDCGGAIALRVGPRRGIEPPRAFRSTAPRFWRAGCAGVDESGNMRAVVAPGADGGG